MMKSRRLILFTMFGILIAALLSACGGAAPTSWAGLTVSGDTVHMAFNQNITLINLEDGTPQWVFPPKPIRGASFFAPPGLTDDNSVVAGGYNKILYFLNDMGLQTGSFEKATNSYIGRVQVVDGIVYAPNADGNLYVLDTKGNLKWTFTSDYGLWAAPLFDGDRIYQASMDHHVYCLDKETGEVIWQSEDLGGAMVNAPALSEDGVLYVGTFDKQLVALDAKTGTVLNRFTAGGWVWATPLLYENRLYFGDLNGNFYTVDAKTLEQINAINPETATKKSINGEALAFKGKIYYTTETGNLMIVDPLTGDLDGPPILIGGKLYGGPVAAGELILVAPMGTGPSLVALDADGKQIWVYPVQVEKK